MRQSITGELACALLLVCTGCSVGTVRFQMIDQQTHHPLETQSMFFKNGAISTNLGYHFSAFPTNEQGMIVDPFSAPAGSPTSLMRIMDFPLNDGEVLYFRIEGYQPVEVHVGLGSMTISESVYSVRGLAAIHKSAREVRFKNGDAVPVPLRRLEPVASNPSQN